MKRDQGNFRSFLLDTCEIPWLPSYIYLKLFTQTFKHFTKEEKILKKYGCV